MVRSTADRSNQVDEVPTGRWRVGDRWLVPLARHPLLGCDELHRNLNEEGTYVDETDRGI
jgi:hypothetical protein